MKLALHRSITFWSGLLVMGFVCWTWWDSTRFISSVGCGSPRGILLSNGFAGISILHDAPSPSSASSFQTYRSGIPTGYNKIVFSATPSPVFIGKHSVPSERLNELHRRVFGPGRPVYSHRDILELRSTDVGCLFLPHWLLLLNVAAVWLALLFWRARRRRRSIPHEAAAP